MPCSPPSPIIGRGGLGGGGPPPLAVTFLSLAAMPPTLPPTVWKGRKSISKKRLLLRLYSFRKGWGWGQAAVCDFFPLA